jgi:hypothetical protein
MPSIFLSERIAVDLLQISRFWSIRFIGYCIEMQTPEWWSNLACGDPKYESFSFIEYLFWLTLSKFSGA